MNRAGRVAAGICVALAISGAALAEPQAKHPTPPGLTANSTAATAYIDHYDESAISDVITAMGYMVVHGGGIETDRPFVAFKTMDGINVATIATACHDDTGKKACYGVQMIAEMLPGKNADADGLVDEFNATYAAAKFYHVDGMVRVSRYLVLDDGVSRDNFKANIVVLLEIAGAIRKEVVDGA
ncbi:MAG: YbjN domain-containing protein [Alphaproteobacteria bacterium]